jgi:hypothetical protein
MRHWQRHCSWCLAANTSGRPLRLLGYRCKQLQLCVPIMGILWVAGLEGFENTALLPFVLV